MPSESRASELASLENYQRANATVRTLLWERRFGSARLLARATLDVLHFGTGRAERLAAALAISAPFFLAFLLFGHGRGADPDTALVSAFVALLAGFLTLAVLGLWGEDEAIRARQEASRLELARAKAAAASARREWEEAQEERRETEAEEEARRERAIRDRETAEEEAERKRLAEPVDCPHCYSKINRKATICRVCRRRVSSRAEPEAPPVVVVNRGLVPPVVAALVSAIIPGLGHVVRGRVLTGLLIMLILFPMALGCGVGIAATGFFTGGFGFVAAAVFLPVVYISIILDSASSE